MTEDAIRSVEKFLKTIPDLEISFTQEETALQSTLGTSQAPFVVEVKGKDYIEIEKIINESKSVLQKDNSY